MLLQARPHRYIAAARPVVATSPAHQAIDSRPARGFGSCTLQAGVGEQLRAGSSCMRHHHSSALCTTTEPHPMPATPCLSRSQPPAAMQTAARAPTSVARGAGFAVAAGGAAGAQGAHVATHVRPILLAFPCSRQQARYLIAIVALEAGVCSDCPWHMLRSPAPAAGATGAPGAPAAAHSAHSGRASLHSSGYST